MNISICNACRSAEVDGSIEGRVVTADDEKSLRAVEDRVSQIIREYESSMRK